MHSSPRWAPSLPVAFQSVSAASSSSFDMGARFHPMTCTQSACSCLLTSNSPSITWWSEPVVSLTSSMVNHVISRVARVWSMVDWPSSPLLAQWLVGRSSCPISSPYSSRISSQNLTLCCSLHLGSHIRLCAFTSAAIIVPPPCQLALCQFSFLARLSPVCMSL